MGSASSGAVPVSRFVGPFAVSLLLACQAEPDEGATKNTSRGAPPFAIQIEAEDCTIQSGNINSGASSSGNRYVDLQSNGSLECNVNEPGKADVTFRIKVPSRARRMGVYSGGKKIGVIETDSTTWVFRSLSGVVLGDTIEVRDTEGTAELDIDALTIEKNGTPDLPALFYEDFQGEPGGAWTCRRCDAQWEPEADISSDGHCKVQITASVWRDEDGKYDPPDHVRLFASVNGGKWDILFEATQNVERQDILRDLTTNGEPFAIRFVAKNSASDEAYHLDNVEVRGLESDGSCTPHPLIEAESCRFEGGNVATTSSASGGAYVEFSSGGRLSCDNEESGARNLVFHVRSPRGPGTMGVFVDGDKVGVISTSSSTWVTRTVYSVELDGLIELRDPEDARELDVDKIEIQPATPPPTERPTEPPTERPTVDEIEITSIEDLDEVAVFTFAAFSDNRGLTDQNAGKALGWMEAANHEFVLAVGDLFNGSEDDDERFLDLWRNDPYWTDRLFPTFGNHCSRINVGNHPYRTQPAWGRPWFTLRELSWTNDPEAEFREPTSERIRGYTNRDKNSTRNYDDQEIDYYYRISHGKFTAHIISVYKQDHAQFFHESVDFMLKKIREIARSKDDYDIVIVFAHDERWLYRAWKDANRPLPNTSMTRSEAEEVLENTDLVLSASDHKFWRICEMDNWNVDNPALQIDTGQVLDRRTNDGYVEFHVFDDPPRFTAQYVPVNGRSSRTLHRGVSPASRIKDVACADEDTLTPMMKIVNGRIIQPLRWANFWDAR